MQILSDVMSWLLILTLVGLVAVIVGIVVGVLRIKNEVLRSAKRLSAPVNSTKNLFAAGKGVVDQETVRVNRIIKRGAITVGVVSETIDHLKVAAEGLRDIDFAALQEHSKEIFRIFSAAAAIFKAAQKYGREQG